MNNRETTKSEGRAGEKYIFFFVTKKKKRKKRKRKVEAKKETERFERFTYRGECGGRVLSPFIIYRGWPHPGIMDRGGNCL